MKFSFFGTEMTPIRSRKHCFQQTLAKLMGKPDRNDGWISLDTKTRNTPYLFFSYHIPLLKTEIYHYFSSVFYFVREFRIIVFSCLCVQDGWMGGIPPFSPDFADISAETPTFYTSPRAPTNHQARCPRDGFCKTFICFCH
mgnify:CR=1 FL=1